MSLPIPHFDLPWQAATDNRITVTYPSGGTPYNADIDDPDAFDSMFSLLVEIASQWSTAGCTAVWPTVTEDGKVAFVSQGSNFDLDLSTAASEVQAWMGFTTGTFSNVASATSGTPYLRGFWPGCPLWMPPALSRTANLLQAGTRGPAGHSWVTTVPAGGSPEGFASATFGVEFAATEADLQAADQTTTPWWRLLSFVAGHRDAALTTSPSWYGSADLAPAFDEVDAIRERGAAEHPFVFFSDWVDPDAHATFSDYATAQDATASTWYLHPDVREVVFSRRQERDVTYWATEWTAFGAVS